jgi:hypothetical protein
MIHDPKKISLYEECLVHDLYLREKLKTRPGFAKKWKFTKKRLKKYMKIITKKVILLIMKENL